MNYLALIIINNLLKKILVLYIINKHGSVAHLGERLHGMEEVASSILVRSTKMKP